MASCERSFSKVNLIESDEGVGLSQNGGDFYTISAFHWKREDGISEIGERVGRILQLSPCQSKLEILKSDIFFKIIKLFL